MKKPTHEEVNAKRKEHRNFCGNHCDQLGGYHTSECHRQSRELRELDARVKELEGKK